jgi:cholesterol transport system auxiliary component
MKALFVLAILLAVSGCVRFGAKPPRELLVLTPRQLVQTGQERLASTPDQIIAVHVPGAAPPIAGSRVPVYQGNVAIAYVKDAVMADVAARQFARVLTETISARTGRLALDLRQSGAANGLKLQGTLQRFGVEEGSARAIVTYDALAMRPDGKIVSKRFEAYAPVGVIEARAVAMALNTAVNDVAEQVAVWIKDF